MPRIGGWAGKRLRINLRDRTAVVEPLTKEFMIKWLGGRGFNMAVLWDEVTPRSEPLGEDNVLCLSAGPLAGTLATTSGRFNISAKSPLTGLVGDSNCGGHFGSALKGAGYDQIVITGKSDRPVYIAVEDESVQIRDAGGLWGRGVYDATNAIKRELGDPNFQVLCIGIAGENLVRYACVISDCCNAAGRTGMGAVMGSKMVKAIAVKGTQGVRVAEPETLEKLARTRVQEIQTEPFYKVLSTYGTTLLNNLDWAQQLCQCKNFQSWEFPTPENLTGSNILRYVSRLKSCASCPISCHRLYTILDGPYANDRAAGPEFETVAHLGYLTMNTDLEVVLRSNTLCNDFGLDTMSTGHAIANAMEWFQHGIITINDTGGIPLEWGNGQAQLQAIESIARREGFGNVLAEGAYNASRVVGGDAGKYVSHVKGMCHLDMRQGYAFALSRVTSTRGNDHLRGDPSMINNPKTCRELFGDERVADPDTLYGKELLVIWQESVNLLSDCLARCRNDGIQYYLPVSKSVMEELADNLSVATGVEWTARDLQLAADRIYSLEQAFCIREGIQREHYRIPWRFANEPIPNGIFRGRIVTQPELEELLDRYLERRGWDIRTTIPTRKKLVELGLTKVADELDKLLPIPGWVGPPLYSDYDVLRSK